MNKNQIILSVDVEDWQQSTWDRNLPISARSAEYTLKLMDILRDRGVKATMFVLGKFSKKYPNIVKKIHDNGHEIACHGFGHVEIFKQSYNKFKSDVEKSKNILEQIIGEPVIGYRAPDFSIVKSSLWSLEILSELGFKYDSSIFPINHRRYGISNWVTDIHRIELNNGLSIVEFPLSTYKTGNVNIPVSGGGYFRLIPLHLYFYFIKQILRKHPFIFYMHPYELNHKEFEEIGFKVPFFTRLHQGIGRKNYSFKIEKLFETFEITTMREVFYNKYNSFKHIQISSKKNMI